MLDIMKALSIRCISAMHGKLGAARAWWPAGRAPRPVLCPVAMFSYLFAALACLVAVACGHLCLLYPHQRGAIGDINTPG